MSFCVSQVPVILLGPFFFVFLFLNILLHLVFPKLFKGRFCPIFRKTILKFFFRARVIDLSEIIFSVSLSNSSLLTPDKELRFNTFPF